MMAEVSVFDGCTQGLADGARLLSNTSNRLWIGPAWSTPVRARSVVGPKGRRRAAVAEKCRWGVVTADAASVAQRTEGGTGLTCWPTCRSGSGRRR